MNPRLKTALGGALALGLLFGIPAVLVRVSMQDVPDRSMTKVVSVYEQAIRTVDATFAKHRNPDPPGRLQPLPDNSHDWIELINPMGRKAAGGGLAILPKANPETGTIGLVGDAQSVTITMPAYRELKQDRTVITARSGIQ